MKAIAALLDKAKKTRSIASDIELAQRLHVTKQAVSNYRAGIRYPDDDTIAQLSKMANDDAAFWLVAVAAERATGAETRKAWAKVAERLGRAAAVALLALLSNSPAISQPREGLAGVSNSETKGTPSIHYAALKIARLLSRLLQTVAGGRQTRGIQNVQVCM